MMGFHFFQMDSSVDRSKKRVMFFFRAKYVFLCLNMAIFSDLIEIIGQHFEVFQMTSYLACIWQMEL